MLSRFDRRVIAEATLEFLRRAQRQVPCHLGGGAALAGAYLGHRMTGDIDLFVHGGARDHRELVAAAVGGLGLEGTKVSILRDAGFLVRLALEMPDGRTEVDVISEPVADVAPQQPVVEGVVVEDLADLRANKLTCILSRSEPRDLVDLYFLEQAGFPPENDLSAAALKDSGLDPAVLAWLLLEFPVEPLPRMIEPISVAALLEFRTALAERFRQVGTP